MNLSIIVLTVCLQIGTPVEMFIFISCYSSCRSRLLFVAIIMLVMCVTKSNSKEYAVNGHYYLAIPILNVILEPSDGNISGTSFHMLTMIPIVFHVPPVLLCFTTPDCWQLNLRARQMPGYLKSYINENQNYSETLSEPTSWKSVYVDCNLFVFSKTDEIHHIFEWESRNIITFDMLMIRQCPPLRTLFSKNRSPQQWMTFVWNGLGSIYDPPTDNELLFFSGLRYYSTQDPVDRFIQSVSKRENVWSFYIGGSPSLDTLLMNRFNRVTSINRFAVPVPTISSQWISSRKAAWKKIVYIADYVSELFGLPTKYNRDLCENYKQYFPSLYAILSKSQFENTTSFIIQAPWIVCGIEAIDGIDIIKSTFVDYSIIDLVDIVITSSIRTVAELAAISKPTILLRPTDIFEIYESEVLLATIVCKSITCIGNSLDEMLFSSYIISEARPRITAALKYHYGHLFIRNHLEFGSFRRLHWLMYHTSAILFRWMITQHLNTLAYNSPVSYTLALPVPAPDDIIKVAMFQQSFVEVELFKMNSKSTVGNCKLQFDFVHPSEQASLNLYHGILIDYGHLSRPYGLIDTTPIKFRPKNQIWIEIAIENEAMYSHLTSDKLRQSFNFDIQAYPRLNSELPFMFQTWSRLHRLPNDVNPQDALRSRDPPFSMDEWMQRTNGILVLYSNSDDSLGRFEFFEELSKYYPVYNYGHHSSEKLGSLGNLSNSVLTDEKFSEKHNLAKKFKFIASFDNSAVENYVSQQLFSGLIARSIPIFDGDLNTALKLIPSASSIISRQDFPSAEAMGKHLTDISMDSNRARQHLKWAIEPHDYNSNFEKLLQNSVDSFSERLCYQIRRRISESNIELEL